MPTLLAPECVKPAHLALLHSPNILVKAESETPCVARRRHKAAKRSVKKPKKTKLVAIVIPVKPGPYSHLPRLKIDGTEKKGKENHVPTPAKGTKDKMRPTRQHILINAVSMAISAPSLALSTWLRPKEKFDMSQVHSHFFGAFERLTNQVIFVTDFPSSSRPMILDWLVVVIAVSVPACENTCPYSPRSHLVDLLAILSRLSRELTAPLA
ncbi:hypothetical protein DXG01_005953 [Tephrocybe rancida]|nr:hypothetical protein DXG01_005953 [Tephrocybe rancida]